MTEILQICQRLNRLRALQHQGDTVLRVHPEHQELMTGLDSADRLADRLERRLKHICAKNWFDLFRYTFQPSNDRPVPAMEVAQSICNFQQLVGVTLDSFRTGRPKERATVPQQIVDKDYFGFGYSFAGAVERRAFVSRPSTTRLPSSSPTGRLSCTSRQARGWARNRCAERRCKCAGCRRTPRDQAPCRRSDRGANPEASSRCPQSA